MSAPFGKNALTFGDVIKFMRTTFEAFADRRTGKNTNYTMTDAGLSAFSVFFMQSPSLRRLESRGSRYAALGAAALYCHEPFCRALLAKGA